MKHLGGGLLCCALLRGSRVTRYSLEVLLEEASPVFVLGACAHGLSLMVTNLSLTFSETMSKQTIGWLDPTLGHKSFIWPGILSTGNSGHFLFCSTLSMWSLYPHSVTWFEDSLLLIVCRHRCSIDSFHPYAVWIDHIDWCCSRGHVILWPDIVPVNCFQYSTPFSGGDPFYSSVTSLDDAITRGDIYTAESKSDSPLI